MLNILGKPTGISRQEYMNILNPTKITYLQTPVNIRKVQNLAERRNVFHCTRLRIFKT